MAEPLPGTYYHVSETDTFPYILPHRSINPEGVSTIVFIHGAFGSHHEYAGVISSSLLEDYHLILPDLHSDGRDITKGIKPFEILRVAELVGHLIKRKAKNGGKAHLVGVSLGAHIVIATAALYPEITKDHCIFISGYNRFQPPSIFKPIIPYAYAGLVKIGNTWPFRSTTPTDNVPHEDVPDDGNLPPPDEVANMEILRHVVDTIFDTSNSGESLLKEQGIVERTCIVVATHKSSGDRIAHSQRLLEKIEGTNCEGRGHILVQNKNMKHPWHMFEPHLFARSTLAWIEGKDLQKGFQPC
ncbi:uncharacterized protein L201_007540 [Kwoniella dendrophila CBS 6074]|uniref:AB hydrolase-1 domain-containing protein n=1 Tax=Kwoniella dendrophila CBS 6074 TaxID=1295534 RepID=A0AAX4K4C7_9TREE